MEGFDWSSLCEETHQHRRAEAPEQLKFLIYWNNEGSAAQALKASYLYICFPLHRYVLPAKYNITVVLVHLWNIWLMFWFIFIIKFTCMMLLQIQEEMICNTKIQYHYQNCFICDVAHNKNKLDTLFWFHHLHTLRVQLKIIISPLTDTFLSFS